MRFSTPEILIDLVLTPTAGVVRLGKIERFDVRSAAPRASKRYPEPQKEQSAV